MRREFERTRINMATRELEHDSFWSYSFNPEEENILVVEKNGVQKRIKIVEDYEFTYKLQKTQIRAIGGASGLYKFLEKEYNYSKDASCFLMRVLNWCMDNCKAAA